MLPPLIYCGSIRLMLRALFALLLAGLAVQSATAVEPQSLIEYGNCEVRTLTNEYLRKYFRTDSKPYAHLACYHFVREPPNPYTVSFSLSRDTTYPGEGFTISLGAGNQFHLSDDPIPVAIRVDQSPPIIQQANRLELFTILCIHHERIRFLRLFSSLRRPSPQIAEFARHLGRLTTLGRSSPVRTGRYVLYFPKKNPEAGITAFMTASQGWPMPPPPHLSWP